MPLAGACSALQHHLMFFQLPGIQSWHDMPLGVLRAHDMLGALHYYRLKDDETLGFSAALLDPLEISINGPHKPPPYLPSPACLNIAKS